MVNRKKKEVEKEEKRALEIVCMVCKSPQSSRMYLLDKMCHSGFGDNTILIARMQFRSV